ncbi:response regulator [Phenylobacterium sp.]|uniref:response regulator n=1 Tax=Phenylobacterium sp. TaxID=1871053 RepID=UPI0011F7D12F|nr:response regulator [Phenylobacterium sp.]THD59564.1 MAG: response regulator [Phenylobacterium sp.]
MSPTEPAALLLYVEDDTFLHEIMEANLIEAGFAVETVSSGGAAIAALEAAPVRFRGLVTDIDLGKGPSGWAVARRARELLPEIPVVYVSGNGSEWGSQGVPESLMLTKPCAFAQAAVAISALVNAGRPAHDPANRGHANAVGVLSALRTKSAST